MKDKKLSDDVSSYFFSFILFPALLLCFFFLEVVITIKSVGLFMLSFRLFFRLIELFCRRNIQRSERKGSFLKNGMILSCRFVSGFRNHSHHKKGHLKTFCIVLCTVCKVKICLDKLK